MNDFLTMVGLSPDLYEEITIKKYNDEGEEVSGVSAIKKLNIQEIMKIQDLSTITELTIKNSEVENEQPEVSGKDIQDKYTVIEEVSRYVFPKIELKQMVKIPKIISLEIGEMIVELKDVDVKSAYRILKGNTTAVTEHIAKDTALLSIKQNRAEMLESILKFANIKQEDIKKVSVANAIINKFSEVVNIEQLELLYDYFCKITEE